MPAVKKRKTFVFVADVKRSWFNHQNQRWRAVIENITSYKPKNWRCEAPTPRVQFTPKHPIRELQILVWKVHFILCETWWNIEQFHFLLLFSNRDTLSNNSRASWVLKDFRNLQKEIPQKQSRDDSGWWSDSKRIGHHDGDSCVSIEEEKTSTHSSSNSRGRDQFVIGTAASSDHTLHTCSSTVTK